LREKLNFFIALHECVHKRNGCRFILSAQFLSGLPVSLRAEKINALFECVKELDHSGFMVELLIGVEAKLPEYRAAPALVWCIQ
jgi:hypothetical protein